MLKDMHDIVIRDLRSPNVVLMYIKENFDKIEWNNSLKMDSTIYENRFLFVQRQLFSKKRNDTLSDIEDYYSYLNEKNILSNKIKTSLVEHFVKNYEVNLSFLLKSSIKDILIDAIKHQEKSNNINILTEIFKKISVDDKDIKSNVNILLENGVKINTNDKENRNILFYIDNAKLFINLISKHCFDLNQKDNYGYNISEDLINKMDNELSKISDRNKELMSQWKESFLSIFPLIKSDIQLSESALIKVLMNNQLKRETLISKLDNLFDENFYNGYKNNKVWLDRPEKHMFIYEVISDILKKTQKYDKLKEVIIESYLDLDNKKEGSLNPLQGIENILKFTESFDNDEKNNILKNLLLSEVEKTIELTNELGNAENIRTLQHSYYKIAYIIINKELEEKYLFELFNENKEIFIKSFLNLNSHYDKNKNLGTYYTQRISNNVSNLDYQKSVDKDFEMKRQEENILGLFCEKISSFDATSETTVLLHLLSVNHIKNLNKKAIDKIITTPVEDLIIQKNKIKELNPELHFNLFDGKKGKLGKSKTLKPFIEKLELSEIMDKEISSNLNNKKRL